VVVGVSDPSYIVTDRKLVTYSIFNTQWGQGPDFQKILGKILSLA